MDGVPAMVPPRGQVLMNLLLVVAALAVLLALLAVLLDTPELLFFAPGGE